jgi:hypothetical protein
VEQLEEQQLEAGGVRRLALSLEISLTSARKSERTIGPYIGALANLAGFLERSGMPVQVASIRREHVEVWIVDELQWTSPASASIRLRSV